MSRFHQCSCLVLAAFWLARPGTVHASQRDMEVLLTGQLETDASGEQIIALRFLNRTDGQEILTLPDRIEAKVRQENRERTLLLTRADDTESGLTVGAHGFGQAHYRLPANETIARITISIPAWSTQEVVLSPLVKIATDDAGTRPSADTPALPPAPMDRKAGNAFADNLDLYGPIYAVYGPGTDSEARIQLSFKYRLFGSQANSQTPSHWRNGLYLAYTQRMFWDLGSKSSPFRNIDFQPELIYITPTTGITDEIAVTAQIGIRHESNGRDGLQSRSINSLYIAPVATLPIASNYSFTLAPRLSLYVGDKSDNPDIVRYRGHAGLFMEVGEDDGLRLSASTRFNFGSGKGAINADLSYPLPRLLGGGPDLYLFAQSFYGYGENLLDYDRRTSRLRIGLALIR